MRTEKGVVAVVYKKPKRAPRYLVLKRKKNWEGWELPKGHLEEDYKQTVKLELKEETGIEKDQIQDIDEMDYVLTWEYEEDGETVNREYRAFIVRVEENAQVSTENNPHEEHETGYFFNFEDTKSLLTYRNQAELLKEAHKNIS